MKRACKVYGWMLVAEAWLALHNPVHLIPLAFSLVVALPVVLLVLTDRAKQNDLIGKVFKRLCEYGPQPKEGKAPWVWIQMHTRLIETDEDERQIFGRQLQ